MSDNPEFSGFPEGRLKATPIPDLFFNQLLPAIENIGELKISLYAMWALARKPGKFQYLRRSEMLSDARLLEALAQDETQGEQALDQALAMAVKRGTLLETSLELGGQPETFYFINSPKGRAGMEGLASGAWRPTGEQERPVELGQEQPNIYRQYEQNFGPLTPMIADTLKQAEEDYSPAWIEEAMRIAVENNVRKWRYVEGILKDWRNRGKDDREDRGDSEKARRRYLEGELGD
ncbi:MAG: DnaD domain protein [Anaerolineales bacterium]|jgi:DnaD/phage-associated family protein